jgi:catechol 2,3-dioxygenase-like lactoylglutathione lyase family enzyme
MKLEVVVLPVSDLDVSKDFYEKAGFHVDMDHRAGADFRVVQLTPPGSACSIMIGTDLIGAPPGSVQGLHLVVQDLQSAISELADRGIEVGDPFHVVATEPFQFEPESHREGLHPARVDYGSYAGFRDPDGNGWLLQEVGWSPQE